MPTVLHFIEGVSLKLTEHRQRYRMGDPLRAARSVPPRRRGAKGSLTVLPSAQPSSIYCVNGGAPRARRYYASASPGWFRRSRGTAHESAPSSTGSFAWPPSAPAIPRVSVFHTLRHSFGHPSSGTTNRIRVIQCCSTQNYCHQHPSAGGFPIRFISFIPGSRRCQCSLPRQYAYHVRNWSL